MPCRWHNGNNRTRPKSGPKYFCLSSHSLLKKNIVSQLHHPPRLPKGPKPPKVLSGITRPLLPPLSNLPWRYFSIHTIHPSLQKKVMIETYFDLNPIHLEKERVGSINKFVYCQYLRNRSINVRFTGKK